jgi:4-hydroxy-tetrahydrodipicolinate synthase
MSIGAIGVVSVIANLLPQETASLTRAALAGDWQAARAWHERLYPLGRELLRLDTNPIPIKTALALRGMMAEEFRLPLCPMEESKRQRLQALLTAYEAGPSRV